MAKIKKKGTSGAAKAYLTRTQAVKKLQISLANFRRLCIFKGIYPREPRNRKKVSKSATHSTVFYYARDIQYLLHEPVLQKFRDHKIFAKKLKRAIGRGDFSDAKRLEDKHTPKITLDHIIKERYPTFNDALRDLDDALSMLHTFANLPSSNGVPSTTIAECERLCNEWKHYIIRTRSLRKSFLSIKGIYYQAEINGQDILWLAPYKFAQNSPLDVDYRIMRTFVDFYQVLLGFVLFRLYTMEGLVYPPKFDQIADANGAALRAFSLESRGVQVSDSSAERTEKDMTAQLKSLQSTIATIASLEPSVMEDRAQPDVTTTVSDRLLDKFVPITSASGPVDTLIQPVQDSVSEDTSDIDPSDLFAPFTFFLSRETPREPLEFLLRSFGCKRVGWDLTQGEGSFTENDKDPRITHQIVDRPVQTYQTGDGTEGCSAAVGYRRVPGRIYVQPQYVWDCVNKGKLQKPDDYAPGAILPPHLSPWIKPGNGYDPTAPLPEHDNVIESENEMQDWSGVEANGTNEISPAEEGAEGNGMTVDMGGSSDDDDGSEDDRADELHEPKKTARDETSESDDESADEEEVRRQQHQAELEAEAHGIPLPVSGRNKTSISSRTKAERDAEATNEMRKIMMPRRKRKLYEKMVYGNKKRAGEVKDLQDKRRKIEREAQKTKPKS